MKFTGYITKFALTWGIIEADLESPDGSDLCVLRSSEPGVTNQYFHGEGKEWHRTKDAAVARANAMKATKLAALRKQMAKIESLQF